MTGEGQVERRWFVRGRVQGVWFRVHTREKAEELGLAGYVRNMPDGGVEVVARGAPGPMDDLEAWLWQGPELARVDTVERTDRAVSGKLDGFEIRR